MKKYYKYKHVKEKIFPQKKSKGNLDMFITLEALEELMKTNKKKHGFKNRYFFEKSTRVKKVQRRTIEKEIKKGNGIFSTHHYEDGLHSYMDICFLSKKDKTNFYNVQVLNVGNDLSHDLAMILFHLKNDGGKIYSRKDRENFLNEYLERIEENKKELPTRFILDKKYAFGTGLTIYINNGKLNFNKEDIIKAIEIFWENGEKDLMLDKIYNVDYIKQGLEEVIRQEGYSIINSKTHEIKKLFEKDLLKKGVLSSKEYDASNTNISYETGKGVTREKILEDLNLSSKVYSKIEKQFELLPKESKYKTLIEQLKEIQTKNFVGISPIDEEGAVYENNPKFNKEFVQGLTEEVMNIEDETVLGKVTYLKEILEEKMLAEIDRQLGFKLKEEMDLL